MSKNFNKETARKDLPLRRPLNVEYLPEAGTHWVYTDAEGEGQIQYQIESAEDGICLLVKENGKDIGFRTQYEIEKLTGQRWRPFYPEGTKLRYLWACPTCGEEEPVYPGDYMCKVCRESLDKS